MDPDQTAPIGAVCSGSTLFASKLNLSVMLGNYLQQTTSADVIFQMHIFLALIRLIIVRSKLLFVCMFDLILYVPSKIFQLYRDGSSWVEPVLS